MSEQPIVRVLLGEEELSWAAFCSRHPALAHELYQLMKPGLLAGLVGEPPRPKPAPVAKRATTTPKFRKGSQHDVVLQLVGHPDGATLQELVKRTRSSPKRVWNSIYYLRAKKGIAIHRDGDRYHLTL